MNLPVMKIDYRITIHAGATQPETKIEIRELPDLIQQHVGSRRPLGNPAEADMVTQVYVRILRDLARENESKFGFDGRRITFTSVEVSGQASPSSGHDTPDWL
jgi:hypothetical protein